MTKTMTLQKTNKIPPLVCGLCIDVKLAMEFSEAYKGK
jgi:hypothetical protein